jgi:hypothetical protein
MAAMCMWPGSAVMASGLPAPSRRPELRQAGHRSRSVGHGFHRSGIGFGLPKYGWDPSVALAPDDTVYVAYMLRVRQEGWWLR